MYMIEEEAGSSGEVKENLDLISEQVDRAAKIIGQIREITRKTDTQFEPVDINSIIQESVEFIKPQLDLSGIETNLHLARELPEVIGDKIRLEQVFLNILANAHYALQDSEERHLVVNTGLSDGEGRYVVTKIIDTGKGFEPTDTEKLFKPFYTTKKSGEGTGLGLSISMAIINNHKGILEATGTPGRGACFTIKLPIPENSFLPGSHR
jgi:C4-dicarboxylate-specific signal transduction histidine kinase